MQEIQGLLKELNNGDWGKRSNAMKSLLRYPEEAYLSFLETALKDQDNALLRNASMEFYVMMGVRALPSLAGLIRDGDEEVRLFVANLLGDIKDKRAFPLLVEALHDPDVNVRVASAEALGKLADSEATDALIKSLDDEPWVTMAAINALGEIGGDRALKALYTCLEKEPYRGIAVAAIEKAGNEESIRYLTPFVDRDGVRELALKAVVNIAVRERFTLSPEYFLNLVQLLVDLQKSPDTALRRAAVIALSWAGDVRGVQYFIDALNDDALQEYALAGLMTVGRKAMPELVAALKDKGRQQRPVIATIVSMLGEYAALIEFAEDEDPEVRVEVALAVGKTESARRDEILSRMLDDPEDEVRLAARKTIETLKGIQ